MIAISDIHLGPGNGRDDFRDDSGFKDLRFGAALAYWKKRGERIILVGDTFECWQANMAEIEAAHPLAMVAIRDCVDVIVRGNHDWRLEEACGKQLVDEWIEGGVRYIHGHQLDIFNSGRLAFVGQAATWLAGRAELIHRDADEWLLSLGARALGRGRHGDPQDYQKKALERWGPRVVIGHTHTHVPWNTTYGNAGTWTGDRQDYVKVR